MGNIVNNLVPGSFTVDGVYIDEIPAQAATTPGPNTNLVAIVGGASWGPLNTPVAFNDQPSAFAAFGNATQDVHSLVSEAVNGAIPLCSSLLGSRVSDGTDAAATLLLLDTPSGGTVLTLTAVYTGSYANGASAVVQLTGGNETTSPGIPIYQITVFFPNANPAVYSGIVGGNSGGYVAATFKANAIAAINGTAPNSLPNPWFTAAAGGSSLVPAKVTPNLASGGLDGASGLTTSYLIGTDGEVGRTGIYALRTLVGGGTVIVAALTDPTVGSTLAEFAQEESCIAGLAFPSGTPTTTAVSTRATDNLSSPFLFLVMDWDYVYDPVAGALRLISPLGKAAGVVASAPAYQYPGNQPVNGVPNIVGTERTAGQPLSFSEQGLRQTNGLLYVYRPIPRGSVFGFPHGMMSDGVTLMSDTRMLNFIALSLETILGPFVGAMVSTNPKDPTIMQATSAMLAFFENLSGPTQPQIANYSIVPKNTVTTIEQGQLIFAVSVQTLSAAKYVIAALQVGNTVQIVTSPA